MAKMNVGVVIARFQTPHLTAAHLELLRLAQNSSDVLCVLLGMSPLDGYVVEHTLSFRQRHAVVAAQFPEAIILPLPDCKYDSEWNANRQTLLRQTFPGATFTYYVGRSSCVDHLTDAHEVVTLQEIPGVSATAIRQNLREDTDESFLRGQIYGMAKQYPHAYATVDVGIIRPAKLGPEVLLIRRADTREWAFVGGFVDPTDETLEAAARREVFEEIGVSIEGDLTYAGSTKVRDWRYRQCRDQIMTTFFLAPCTFGAYNLNLDEVLETAWFPADMDYVSPPVCETHVPLWHLMNKALEKF